MENLLYSKAHQHEDVREILLKTGNAIICENNPNDTYWGLGIDEKGENNLGKLWMKIRNKIQNR